MLGVDRGFSSSTATLYVEPSSIVSQTYVVGTNFVVNVSVSDVVGLYGFEFKLGYNTTVLDGISVVKGPFFPDPPKIFVAKMLINETMGFVWVGVTLVPPEPARSGSGTLATITFRVAASGRSPLNLYDDKLGDGTGSPIPHNTVDSHFDNLPPAKLLVFPKKIVNPLLTPPQSFQVSVNISQVMGLHNFEFRLGYNTTILDVADAIEGPFLKAIGSTYISKFELNETLGFVWVAVSLVSSGLSASGDGTLMTFTFNVTNVGNCTLNLYGNKLYDADALQIVHEVANGYFDNRLPMKATMSIDPPVIKNPEMLPPELFTINVDIGNVTDLYGFTFNLTYNTVVLNGLGVVIIPFPNQTDFVVQLSIDDAVGVVWVNVTYHSPAEPLTSYNATTLAVVTFQVADVGDSPLDLNSLQLTNFEGMQIWNETYDGFFSNKPLHDLAVLDVSLSSTKVYCGWSVDIDAVVRNEGSSTETFSVTAYAFNETYSLNYTIGSQPIVNMNPGAETTIRFRWDTSGVRPCTNYTIQIKAEILADETDVADNSYIDGNVKVKLMGDVNGDKTVDVFDLILIGAVFSSKLGDAKWNPDADLNNDSKIDVFDLILAGTNFGKTC